MIMGYQQYYSQFFERSKVKRNGNSCDGNKLCKKIMDSNILHNLVFVRILNNIKMLFTCCNIKNILKIVKFFLDPILFSIVLYMCRLVKYIQLILIINVNKSLRE